MPVLLVASLSCYIYFFMIKGCMIIGIEDELGSKICFACILLLLCDLNHEHICITVIVQVSTNPSAVGGCSCKSSFMV